MQRKGVKIQSKNLQNLTAINLLQNTAVVGTINLCIIQHFMASLNTNKHLIWRKWVMSTAPQEKIMAETKTIAVVGFSSRQSRAGYYVPAYLQKQGYKIIPVNPYIENGLGELAYPDLPSLPHSVDLVLLFQRSENVPPFVDQAIAIGAKFVWMQFGIQNEEAAQKAEKAGLIVVQNACMLVEHRQWIN